MEFFFFEDRVLKLGRKIRPTFKLKFSKSKQDPLNIKDFMAQNVIFCLPKDTVVLRCVMDTQLKQKI